MFSPSCSESKSSPYSGTREKGGFRLSCIPQLQKANSGPALEEKWFHHLQSCSKRAVLEKPQSFGTSVALKSKHQLNSCLHICPRRKKHLGKPPGHLFLFLHGPKKPGDDPKKSCILTVSINQIAKNFVVCLAPVEAGSIC